MLQFNAPTMCTLVLVGIGAAISAPVLIKGFTRRGTGVKYEQNFKIQRAPQMMTLVNVIIIVLAFLGYNGVLDRVPFLMMFAATNMPPEGGVLWMSWLGNAILVSGLIFMIGGWYSLGECFSTDAEVLDGHTVRSDGLLKFVMHPAYSGIIQCLLGASLAATSIAGAACAVCLVAPLWLNRAKYEEKLLIESLGQSYKDYAENMKWRRLVPTFIPIGV